MSDAPAAAAPVEFSRPFRIADFAHSPAHEIEIVVTPAERRALAARFSLISLDDLQARLTVRREPADEIIVVGQLRADLVQECVVTLDPVRDTIAAPFEQRYTLRPADPAADLVIGPDDLDPPESVSGDAIDLGELVAQFLSLSINPYPRSPEADAQAPENQAEAPRDGPFAVLARLRDRDPA